MSATRYGNRGAVLLRAALAQRSDLGLLHDPFDHVAGDVLLVAASFLTCLVHFDPRGLPRRPVAGDERQSESADTYVVSCTQPVANDTGIIRSQKIVSQPLMRRMNTGSPCTGFPSAPS